MRLAGSIGARQAAADLGIHATMLRDWTGVDAELARMRREISVLKQEREILKKAAGILGEGVPVRHSFIEGHRLLWPLTILCRVLAVSVSGYLSWRSQEPTARRQRDIALATEIAASHTASRGSTPTCARPVRPSAASGWPA